MKPYKRAAIDRDVTFRPPSYNCHACNDSGLVHNSDGCINNYLDDYDQRYDLAIICYCEAVYPKYNEEGQLVSHGFRDGDGNIKNSIGVDVDKDIIRELHNIRKKGWETTAKLMNKHIQKNLKSKKVQLPEEIQDVKDKLVNLKLKSLNS
tara:strand:+ start:89 stop:538 length:450 start_codon:yes stop_codon:yes gene_type:complete